MTPDIADQLMAIAGVSMKDLASEVSPPAWPSGSPPGNSRGALQFPSLSPYVSFSLSEDPGMRPRFEPRDLVFFDQGKSARTEINSHSIYLVFFHGQVLARYLRFGGNRLYLVTEDSLNHPARWDFVSLGERHILDIVRGRIVWICRQLESTETRTPEEAGGNH